MTWKKQSIGLKKADKNSFLAAQYQLGLICRQNYEKAFYWFDKASQQITAAYFLSWFILCRRFRCYGRHAKSL